MNINIKEGIVKMNKLILILAILAAMLLLVGCVIRDHYIAFWDNCACIYFGQRPHLNKSHSIIIPEDSIKIKLSGVHEIFGANKDKYNGISLRLDISYGQSIGDYNFYPESIKVEYLGHLLSRVFMDTLTNSPGKGWFVMSYILDKKSIDTSAIHTKYPDDYDILITFGNFLIIGGKAIEIDSLFAHYDAPTRDD